MCVWQWGAAVNIDDGGILPIAPHVMGNIEQRGNCPLTVAAWIMNQEWLNHLAGRNSGHERLRDLARAAVNRVVHPSIFRRVWAVVIVEQARAVARESGFCTAEIVHT